MAIIKVLKRRDASSVVVAVTIATILAQLLPSTVGNLASKILNLKDGTFLGYSAPGASWVVQYVYPFVLAILELILLEVLIWIYVGLHSLVTNKK